MFFERAKAAQALQLTDARFGRVIRFMPYLSLPVEYNQLFPTEYVTGLKDHLKSSRKLTLEAAIRQFTSLPTSVTLIGSIQATFSNALAAHEIYSARELARLLGIPEERVRGWVEDPTLRFLHRLEPIIPPKLGGSGVLRFFESNIRATMTWHLPEDI